MSRIDELENALIKATEAIQELKASPRLVHERVIFGFAGDTPINYGNSWGFGGYAGRIVYYPFNDSFTGAPVKSAGATRKYKLHLIFTDDMSPPNNGKTQIRFVKTDNGGEYVRFHDISRTWGEVADRSRDESTDPVLASEYSGYARHVRVEIRTTHPQGYGRLFYLALQTWDVY